MRNLARNLQSDPNKPFESEETLQVTLVTLPPELLIPPPLGPNTLLNLPHRAVQQVCGFDNRRRGEQTDFLGADRALHVSRLKVDATAFAILI